MKQDSMQATTPQPDLKKKDKTSLNPIRDLCSANTKTRNTKPLKILKPLDKLSLNHLYFCIFHIHIIGIGIYYWLDF